MSVLGSSLAAAPSTAERMELWRRRSHRVFFARRWLPRLGAALLVFTLLWIVVRAVIAVVLATDYQSGEVHMIHPKFLGRDDKGRPYAVTALDAVRDSQRPDRVKLTQPVMVLDNPGEAASRMTALRGDLDQTAHRLVLAGNVVADDGKGAIFRSEHAVVDTDGGAVRGDSAVEGVGPLGRITASSYSIDPHGDHIVFSGGVRSHIVAHTQASEGGRPLKPRL